MEWILYIGLLIVVVIIIAVAYSRTSNDGYHAGSGMFKNSENNLDDSRKDICDVDYFNRDGKMK